MTPHSDPPLPTWRDRLANNLGVSPSRKEQFYCDLIQSVTLSDITYWLQVLLAAGIATLGLVLNSPAVIIGAMLISPLMGPILANGMAFAAGDVVLAIRAIASLSLSCFIAVTFAMLLIWVMPFKEQTTEILARTQPNALDLVIALFSGLLGSIATTKEPRGVVTSIPGVAIAVALMPPLCVVGYGIGLALSINPVDGWPIARGGALLFFTNLTAITLMAMLVFVLLHIATPAVQQEVKDWHLRDSQSRWILSFLRRLPASKRLRIVGSLPSRFFAILLPILILLAPLQASLKRLQADIQDRQQSNRIRKVVTEVWQESFAHFSDGRPRAYLSELASPQFDENNRLTVQMTVFTRLSYSAEEQEQLSQQLAAELERPLSSILLQLVEIPTTAYELSERERLEPLPEQAVAEIPAVSEAQQQFLNAVDAAMVGFNLPQPAQLLRYDVVTNARQSLRIRLVYLSSRPISSDAQLLLAENVLERLQSPQAVVQFEQLPEQGEAVQFSSQSALLTREAQAAVDRLAAQLSEYPQLEAICQIRSAEGEEPEITIQRYMALRDRLVDPSKVQPQRLTYMVGQPLPEGSQPRVEFQLRLASAASSDTPEIPEAPEDLGIGPRETPTPTGASQVKRPGELTN